MLHRLVVYHVLVVLHLNVLLARVVTDSHLAVIEIAFTVARAGTKLLQPAPSPVLQGAMMSVTRNRFALDTLLVPSQRQTSPSTLSIVVRPLQRPPRCARMHARRASILIALMANYATLTPLAASEIHFFVD